VALAASALVQSRGVRGASAPRAVVTVVTGETLSFLVDNVLVDND
jgi:hypothetical protein